MGAYRVGLTGGLASGKSTVARWLGDAGFRVVDADEIVADLYRPGQPGAAAVAALFGREMLAGAGGRAGSDEGGGSDQRRGTGSDEEGGVASERGGGASSDTGGGVDKARLAARVFADPRARRDLEAAIHPLVRRRYAEISAGASGVIVFEATLMVESGSAQDFDLVVTIEADAGTRLRRAVARGMPEAAARARLAAQGDGAVRRAGAQRVLDNDGDLAALRRQVDALIAELRRHGSNEPDRWHESPEAQEADGSNKSPGANEPHESQKSRESDRSHEPHEPHEPH